MRIRELVEALVWLLPASTWKNRRLTTRGHRIDPTAVVRSSVVMRVTRVTLGRDSRLGRWNLIKDLREVTVGDEASIGRLNVISSHPVYKRLYRTGAALHLGRNAKITSRHQLDCSGSLTIGDYASLAGHDTKVLSHSVDLRRDAQVAHPVEVGERSFVGARCLLLGGSMLPARSVLAAGSVLARAKGPVEEGVWAGVPARLRGPVSGKWFERTSTGTRRVYDPSTDETVEDAF